VVYYQSEGEDMRNRYKVIIIMILGNVLLGIAVGFLRIAQLGTDPFATMNIGVSSKLGLSLGVYQVIFNVVLFTLMLIKARHLIGFGTLVNMVILGFISDFVVALLEPDKISEMNIVVQILLLTVGVIITAIGLSLYMSAELGISPYDALPLMIEGMTNNKISFKFARMIVDSTAVVIGLAFGAVVGIGTLIVALSLGPLVAYFNMKLSKPIIKNMQANRIVRMSSQVRFKRMS
jgi:hypothetical protein